MKRNNLKIVAFLMVTCLFFSSCKKEGVKVFKGDYTYNTSGDIIVKTTGISSPVKLFNSTGQMEILDVDEDNRVMVVKRSLTGDVTSTYATIDGDQITFEPSTITKAVTLLVEYGIVTVTCSASGKIYGDKTIMINETYNGTFAGQGAFLNVSGTVSGDNILTIAKRNED